MKANIAPHGYKGKDKDKLKTDSSQCFPTGIQFLISISSMKK